MISWYQLVKEHTIGVVAVISSPSLGTSRSFTCFVPMVMLVASRKADSSSRNAQKTLAISVGVRTIISRVPLSGRASFTAPSNARSTPASAYCDIKNLQHKLHHTSSERGSYKTNGNGFPVGPSSRGISFGFGVAWHTHRSVSWEKISGS